MLSPPGCAYLRWCAALRIGQEAEAGQAAHPAADIAAALVVAGDPYSGRGLVDLVRPEAAVAAVPACGAGGIGEQLPAQREAAEPRCRDRARPGLVAGVGVVRPALVAADVDRAGVGGDRVQRVA